MHFDAVEFEKRGDNIEERPSENPGTQPEAEVSHFYSPHRFLVKM